MKTKINPAPLFRILDPKERTTSISHTRHKPQVVRERCRIKIILGLILLGGLIKLGFFLFDFSSVQAQSGIKVKEARIENFVAHSAQKENFQEYLSPISQAEFPFNVIGLKIHGQWKEDLRIYLRTKDRNWSDWQEIEKPEETGKLQAGLDFSEPFFVKPATQFQYCLKWLSNEAIKNIDKIEVIYLDSKGEKQKRVDFKTFFRSLFQIENTQAAASSLKVISRVGWEADESLRLNSQGEVIWPVQYQTPEKFIIHHTAGSNGGDDPEATVRGVYYWHARVMGWGDIGYNYLIDPEGHIYEGRFGGDGVIGAHAFRDAGCNEIRFQTSQEEKQGQGIDFNPGSIGISVLGNYEDKDELNSKITTALTTLIAHKAQVFNIAPQGEGFFKDDIYPNIVGHKDVDCTLCPGKNLYEALPQIRTQAKNKLQALGGLIENPTYAASLIKQSATTLNLEIATAQEVWVDFKNTGDVAWHNYGDNIIYLVVDQASDLKTQGWISETRVTTLSQANVAPSQTGRFTFTIQPSLENFNYQENFHLNLNNQPITNTNVSLAVNTIGPDYAASLTADNIKPATFVNDAYELNLKFQNRGIKKWTQDNLVLKTFDLDYQPAKYQDESWNNQTGNFTMQEEEVKTLEEATFKLILKSPPESGLYKQIFQLALKNSPEFTPESEIDFITRVDSHYQAELVYENLPPALLKLWRPTITFKFKNAGIATWTQNMVLNIYDLGYAVSKFQSSTWPDKWGEITMQERIVEPGQIATFRFRLAPQAKGLYKQIFKLNLKNKNLPVQNGEVDFLTRVD